MDQPVELRVAVDADAARISALHVLGWQAGYHTLLPQHLLDCLQPGDRVDRWRATIRHTDWPRRGTLLAEHAGELLGFLDLRSAPEPPTGAPVGEVASFYVLSSAWGRGVGSRLMAAACDAFREAGCMAAALWVLETNARSIAIYEHLGWSPDGASRDDTVGAVRIRDVRMRLDLNTKAVPPPSRTPATRFGADR